MIDEMPVVDAVVHPYNADPSNFASQYGEALTEMLWAGHYFMSPPGYRIAAPSFMRNWSVEETLDVAFTESDTDLAVIHVLPLSAYKDNCVSVEKAVEAKERWPDRTIVYGGIDPLRPDALEEFERQFELLDPIGFKMYPSSWLGGKTPENWMMNDPEVAYPLFERARQLGVKVMAIHKALPMGPVERKEYAPDDVDRAAIDFPDLIFEVVHGGSAFVEESAWQLARFPNVFVNLETTSSFIATRPKEFETVLAQFASWGGDMALSRVMWGTGCAAYHPEPLLERFKDFQFSDEVIEGIGVAPLSDEARAGILGGNFARMAGLDLDQRMKAIANDDFSRRLAEGKSAPWSTTASADHVE
jgi:hypothetical protein